MSQDIFEAFADLLADKIAERLNGTAKDAPVSGTKSKATTTKKSAAKAEPVEDDEDEGTEEESGANPDRVAELKGTNIRTLRKMAIALGFDEEEVAGADKATLCDSIAEAEAEEGDDEQEVEEEDESEDETDEEVEDEGEEDYTREDYEGLSLADLKGHAKEAGYKPADLKGLDKDSIIDLLLGEGDDEGDDDDEEELSEDDLREMSLAELKALCKDYDIKVPRGAKADDLIELLMEEDEEEDEED